MKSPRHEPRRAPRWARLAVDAPCPFRRGAWYPVLSIGENEVVIEARRKSVIVPRSYLDLLAVRPSNTWTLIPRESGGPYLVCPNCGERVWWRRSFVEMQCRRCDGVFKVLDLEHGGRLAERRIAGD